MQIELGKLLEGGLKGLLPGDKKATTNPPAPNYRPLPQQPFLLFLGGQMFPIPAMGGIFPPVPPPQFRHIPLPPPPLPPARAEPLRGGRGRGRKRGRNDY